MTDWQLRQLAALNWIDSVFNVILIGPPGTGKTHIALAIGNKALDAGYKVFFASMDSLMHILKTQEISRASAGVDCTYLTSAPRGDILKAKKTLE